MLGDNEGGERPRMERSQQPSLSEDREFGAWLLSLLWGTWTPEAPGLQPG